MYTQWCFHEGANLSTENEHTNIVAMCAVAGLDTASSGSTLAYYMYTWTSILDSISSNGRRKKKQMEL